MPWDKELAQLIRDVRHTFGDEAYEDALVRALEMMRKAHPEVVEGTDAATASCYEALRLELRRLRQAY